MGRPSNIDRAGLGEEVIQRITDGEVLASIASDLTTRGCRVDTGMLSRYAQKHGVARGKSGRRPPRRVGQRPGESPQMTGKVLIMTQGISPFKYEAKSL